MAKIMVVIGFLIAFAAGLAVGVEMRRPSAAQGPAAVEPPTRTTTGPSTRRSPGSWVASELKLSPEQRKKMDAIWSEVARGGREEMEKERDALRKQRDEAIIALVGPEKKEQYDQIFKDYDEQRKAAERKMRGRFEKAVEETQAILDDEQREKYEKLLARYRPPGDRDGRGRGGPRGPGGSERENLEHRRGGDDGATSRPVPQP